jgi:hypothetical protein
MLTNQQDEYQTKVKEIHHLRTDEFKVGFKLFFI